MKSKRKDRKCEDLVESLERLNVCHMKHNLIIFFSFRVQPWLIVLSYYNYSPVFAFQLQCEVMSDLI